MSVWEAIEKASDGTPEAQLCQFHQANLGMVQGLYDSIAKRIAEMEAQERKWSQVERYQKVLDAVNQVFGKPVAITSAEQAAEMRQSLQDHISSLEALGPIVPSHQERLEQLRQMQQSVEQQEKRLAFHALVTQQQQHVEEAFASINKSLQDRTADPKEVLGQIVLLRDWLIAEQEALGAYSSIDQQVAQGNYLHANEENVTKLLASYAHQHRIEKEEVQAIEESLRVLNLSVQESQGQPKDEQAKLQKEVAAYLQEGEKLQSQVPTSKANQEYSARGKALLQQIVQLEKETEASYQAIQKTYLSDNSDIGNQQLEKQLREKEADLASIRATKAKLLSALDIATQEIVEAYLEKVSEKPAHNGDEAGVETKNTQTEQAKGAEEKEEPKGHDDQQTSNQESKNIKTWDSITDTRIAQLDDRLQAPAKEFINTVEKQFGIQLRVTQSFRSFEEQEALYAKGRTVSGRIVTNARGGQSYHNYGLAFDVVIMRNGQAVWESLPKDIADIAISLGFEWGGNWRTFKDYPHFQMTFGQSIKELQASVSTNKK